MSNLRKKKIKKRRGEIEEPDRDMRGAATVEEWNAINAVELHQRIYLEEDLRVLETEELQEKTRPFGINLFPMVRPIDEPKLWDTTRDGRRALEARKNFWKGWIDIVAPITATIISIIALNHLHDCSI